MQSLDPSSGKNLENVYTSFMSMLSDKCLRAELDLRYGIKHVDNWEEFPGSTVASYEGSEGYGQCWCMGSRGGVCLSVLKGLPIAECDAVDQLSELL